MFPFISTSMRFQRSQTYERDEIHKSFLLYVHMMGNSQRKNWLIANYVRRFIEKEPFLLFRCLKWRARCGDTRSACIILSSLSTSSSTLSISASSIVLQYVDELHTLFCEKCANLPGISLVFTWIYLNRQSIYYE